MITACERNRPAFDKVFDAKVMEVMSLKSTNDQVREQVEDIKKQVRGLKLEALQRAKTRAANRVGNKVKGR